LVEKEEVPMSGSNVAETAAQPLDLVVRQMRWEVDGVLGLRLEAQDGTPLPPWEPGAHVDVRLPNGVERQYSLCSDPADRGGWEIAVLREDVSRGGSRWIHRELRAGGHLEVSAPLNHFAFEVGTPAVFIAGGIGITPLLPMIRAAQAAGTPWRLAYLGRGRDTMAFLDDPVLQGPEVSIVPSAEAGRLDVEAWIGTPGAGERVYACGPAGLLDRLEELSSAWAPGTLRVERFQARSFADLVDGEAFEVEAKASGLKLTVESGCSILEMLEQAGIPVPSSCLEGVCGTCETDIVDGEAEHRDSILSPEERASNETMMICVSRARTPSLVLDI
jgi:ferredoxin-NADP reductase